MNTGALSYRVRPLSAAISCFLFSFGVSLGDSQHSVGLTVVLAGSAAVLIYCYESLVALQVVRTVIEMIPGYGALLLREPDVMYIKCSVVAFVVLAALELIFVRKDVRFVTATTLWFYVFIGFLLIRTLSGVNDFSLNGSDKYWLLNAFQLVNRPLLLFILAYILPHIHRRYERFFLFLLIGAVVAGIGLYFLNHDVIRMKSVSALLVSDDEQKITPIAIGRLMGAGALVALVYLLRSDKKWLRLCLALLSGFLAAIMVMANERGPVLSFILAMLLALWLYRTNISRKISLWFLILATLMLGMIGYTTVNPDANRLSATFAGGVGAESRLEIYSTALDVFASNCLLGAGYGGFGAATKDFNYGYPHNIFLEVMTESGTVGLIIFLVFMRYLKSSITNVLNTDVFNDAAVILLVFYLLNAQVSGSLCGNSEFFLFAGLIAGTDAVRRRVSQTGKDFGEQLQS
ncbi:MAG: hypothetical protein A2075_16625 [Geobacteraceae bacterium GWC2_58_44]|nr:MAG: hypothetical protein A2075_16625 [Geobacteraceae bacterium GWC2_58_44]